MNVATPKRTSSVNEDDVNNQTATTVIRSCLAGPDNPKTIHRKKLDETGNSNILHFDERVVVHTVPYWDPCGPPIRDDDDDENQHGQCSGCCNVM